MGQSQPEVITTPLTVEGLDHVFVDIVDSEIVEGVPVEEQAIPQGVPAQCEDTVQGIPVDEAAKLLATSTRAVIKRLQKGTLKGFKVPGKFGDKWLVDPQGIPVKDEGTPGEIPRGIPVEEQAIPQGVPVEIVQELMHKVEALTYRNGYLEAQLAEKETHIKLLTDSQHNSGWWMRFSSWFLRH